MVFDPYAGMNQFTAVLFSIDAALFMLAAVRFRFSWWVSLSVALGFIVTTIILIMTVTPGGPSALIDLLILLVPGFIGIFILSDDKPMTTTYFFFDRHNLGLITNTLYFFLQGFLGEYNPIAISVGTICSLGFLLYTLKIRPQTRQLLDWMNGIKAPFFLYPLVITVFMRALLGLAASGETWALYISLGASALVLMSSFLISFAVQQNQKAAEGEMTLAELRMVSSQMLLMREYIECYDEQRETLARQQHDLRHHNHVLLGLLASGEITKAISYINGVDRTLNQFSTDVYCKHHAVNAVLSIYIARAKEQDINVKYRLDIPDDIPIDAVELSSVYANAFENAMQACQRISPDKERCIKLFSELKDNKLGLLVQNTCEPGVKLDADGLPQSNHKNGGVGMRSMHYIVNKYCGLLDFYEKDGWFELKIIFFI